MIQTPKDEGDWFAFANGCEKCWQFPNCVGAIDGKHDNIVKQEKSGSLYFNYKKTFSIILFALVDSECKFAYIDAGTPETKGDRSVWQNTPLQKEITRNTAHLPDIMPTSSGLQIAPVIVGDDAFPLSPNLIKRYPGQELAPPQRIFNYGYVLFLCCEASPNAPLCILLQALQGTSSFGKRFRHLGALVHFDDSAFQNRKSK
ncbi:hypothetical protein HPB48_010926 [Haemaphysalis longicornis]|uniref:DDE Tnp4 domain-containing protein n=1 Tax=Haemaphysalis longicornis TaxID=44386 RepID=A0A9J6H5W5_HAELO|nr:hypothetical protein HPB48_010926 [Haemaphysalis longicornis]